MDPKPPSPTRTKATWKPRIDESDPCFFAADELTLVGLNGSRPAQYREPGRSPVAEMPYQQLTASSDDLSALPVLEAADLPEGFEFSYRIVGGYDTNAVQVRWRIPADARDERTGEPVQLRWAMLKTFTGLQVKYPLPGKRPPLVFALADEDAYVYCDEPVCKECTFRCKQGLVLYGAFEGVGIVRVPLSPNRS